MVSISTWIGSIQIVQLGLYFSGHTISRVIFTLNTFFDGGAITYLALYWIQQWTTKNGRRGDDDDDEGGGASTSSMLSGYLVLAVLIYGGALYFWTIAVPENEGNPNEDDASRLLSQSLKGISSRHLGLEISKHGTTSIELLPTKRLSISRSSKRLSSSSKDAAAAVATLERMESTRSTSAMTTTNNNGAADGTSEGDPPQERQEEGNQLRSTQFILLCVFFAIQVSSTNWNLATQRDFLASLGDDEYDNMYLSIFTLLTPVSILGAPFIDLVILKFGWRGAFQMINLLSIAYILIKVTSSSLNVQIVGFIIFSFYRSFLFGISFSFLPRIVEGNVAGLAAGIMAFSAGIINVFEMLLVNLAVKKNGGDFLVPNLIFLALMVPTIIVAFQLGESLSMEDDEENEGSTTNKEVEDEGEEEIKV